mmetsp:Transcript_6442/g.11767  ORF Transcript_6442/g.11767 Transcript_6442/m.11767 type:complete len:103 (+) Transcript_6442:159-467(+)
MSSRARATGVNLIISSLLATLSYLPFEIVAKGTLVICILLFVLDPFPESSRLVALAGVMGVLLINRARQRFVMLPPPSNASSFSDDGVLQGDDDEQQKQKQK